MLIPGNISVLHLDMYSPYWQQRKILSHRHSESRPDYCPMAHSSKKVEIFLVHALHFLCTHFSLLMAPVISIRYLVVAWSSYSASIFLVLHSAQIMYCIQH